MTRKISTTLFRISFTLILISLFSFSKLMAQNQQPVKEKEEVSECTQNLDQARTLFDDGRIHEIPSKLERCLVSGFTDAEKTEALRLLVLTHIYLEEPEKADQRMLELLKHEHEFQPNPAVDPTEFILLFQTYRTKPIFNVALKVGANSTFVQTRAVNGVYNTSISGERGKNSLKPSFQASLGAEVALSPLFTLAPEFQFAFQSWKFTSSELIQTGTSNGGYQNADLTADNNFTWLKLPILVQYNFMPGKFNPYVELGPSFDYLLGSQSDLTLNMQDQRPEITTVTKDSEFNSFNIALALGAGVKLKVGEGFLTGEIRYQYGFLDNTDKYYNTPSAWEGKYVNNQFKQHVLQISLGYILNIYSPKKLTK